MFKQMYSLSFLPAFIDKHINLQTHKVISFLLSDTAITQTPSNKTLCEGDKDVSLKWQFDNEANLSTAIWNKGDNEIIVSKVGSATATVQQGYINKFRYISNGEIQIIKVTKSDEDTYKLTVNYIAELLLPVAETNVSVTVNICGKYKYEY